MESLGVRILEFWCEECGNTFTRREKARKRFQDRFCCEACMIAAETPKSLSPEEREISASTDSLDKITRNGRECLHATGKPVWPGRRRP